MLQPLYLSKILQRKCIGYVLLRCFWPWGMLRFDLSYWSSSKKGKLRCVWKRSASCKASVLDEVTTGFSIKERLVCLDTGGTDAQWQGKPRVTWPYWECHTPLHGSASLSFSINSLLHEKLGKAVNSNDLVILQPSQSHFVFDVQQGESVTTMNKRFSQVYHSNLLVLRAWLERP